MYQLNLRLRIYLILGSLLLVTIAGGFITVWYTFRMEKLLTSIIQTDVAALRMAEEMEIALINQKGFVSYYFLDGDPDWLRQLGEYRQIFKERLKKARTFVDTKQEADALAKIESEYKIYIQTKDQVIDYYKAGERKIGGKLHQEARNHFFKILSLGEAYKKIYFKRMQKAKEKSQNAAKEMRLIACAGIFFAILLSLLLALVMVKNILDPVRKLIWEAEKQDPPYSNNNNNNEIAALSRSVRGLIKDAGQTHIELQRSRKYLMKSEKMVMIGKLAAGMAHSIRNPLTSVKMRLFSLSRSLELTDTQQEDFDVISEEIRHTDTIVQNFLEFSRPPKLNMQLISPSVIVDNAIRLMEHRLKSYDVDVKVERYDILPNIEGDPEQLKEILVNLMVNACEAMERSGTITFHEQVIEDEHRNKAAVIKLSDNGPGIEASMTEKIFQPFFTTKEEGTGLGLSIALRIIEEHHGLLDMISEEGKGTTFIITLPINE